MPIVASAEVDETVAVDVHTGAESETTHGVEQNGEVGVVEMPDGYA